MKKIMTNGRLSYRKIADIVIDRNRLYSETIGVDADGNYILHKSTTINMGSGYGDDNEYFYLSKSEYQRLLGHR